MLKRMIEIRKEQESRERRLAVEKARAEEEAKKQLQLKLEEEKKRREREEMLKREAEEEVRKLKRKHDCNSVLLSPPPSVMHASIVDDEETEALVESEDETLFPSSKQKKMELGDMLDSYPVMFGEYVVSVVPKTDLIEFLESKVIEKDLNEFVNGVATWGSAYRNKIKNIRSC